MRRLKPFNNLMRINTELCGCGQAGEANIEMALIGHIRSLTTGCSANKRPSNKAITLITQIPDIILAKGMMTVN
jgi:hypothetical protein